MERTEDEERREFIGVLARPTGLVAQAYGAEDPRASFVYSSTLTLLQMFGLYREAVKVIAPRAVSAAQRDWFRSLPHSEKIRVLTSAEVGSHYKRFFLQERDRTQLS